MKNNIMLINILLVVLLLSYPLYSKENANFRLYKNTIYSDMSMINIGNWGYWIQNEGTSANNPYTGGSGGYYPRGTVGAIYKEGLVWGGIVNDPDTSKKQLRVGGNTYHSGMQPGWIETPGNGISLPIPVDPDHPNAKIYRIRSDWSTLELSDLTNEAAELFNIEEEMVTDDERQQILDEYKSDWKDWPVNLGAPYYDTNENGIYDPVLDTNNMPIPAEGDYPGLQNADQVLWYVMNDLNEASTVNLYGSPPIGLEVQVTAWSYNQVGSTLGHTVFKRYRIYNFSGFDIDSMYVSQWVDPDIGMYGNDLCGYDEELELAYSYNGEETDEEYLVYELTPPAVGYTLIQGPVIPSVGDTAIFDYEKLANFKNLRPSSFGYFGTNTEWSDPDLGIYDGTLKWYNLLRGYAPTTDVDSTKRWIHTTGDSSGVETFFPLNGDPITGTGDIDGILYQPGDRRICLNCGPFDLHDGDSQELVVTAVAGTGINIISSVSDMKENVEAVRDTFVLTSISNEEKILPREIFLYQNYPNPFNPRTTIKYTVGANDYSPVQHINLSIYNILGQKVATLVNKKQPAGRYQVEWDASAVSSGIYYYRLETEGYSDVKKMVVIK